jgi:hypothetical protein
VAGGRPARDPDGTFGLGIDRRQGDESIEGKKLMEKMRAMKAEE